MAGSQAEVVTEAFRHRFGSGGDLRLYRAPGRVNLIGEHTDYNLGLVLPIALDMACYAAASPSGDDKLRVYSHNLEDTVEVPVGSIAALEAREHWSDYPLGVAQQLFRFGVPPEPLNIAFHSTVPVGSGLSSSAAIEVASLLALLHGRPLDRAEMAKLAQRAEREFVGVPVGIMDQYVSIFGEEGKAICIDCRTLTHQSIPLPPELSIVAVNSMVKHDLGSSEYPVRVRECAEAVTAIQAAYPAVQSLRDVSSDMLDRVRKTVSEKVFCRARHVISENERVMKFTAAAAKGDLLATGRLFLASHRSLQHDYEVSSPELDFLVDTASGFSGVYGARMTGGGFGGCTVNLVSPERSAAFRQHVAAAYERHFDRTPQIYDCVPAQGAQQL